MTAFSLAHRLVLSRVQKKRYDEGKNKTAFKKGHVPTPEMRKKMGAKGENHPMWKGGITRDKKKYRNEWRKKNLQKALEYMRAWKKSHRDRVNVYTINYRARARKAEGFFTLEEWEEKKKQFNNLCAICGSDKKLTIDHIIPLIKNGTNFINNIQPLCESCNYSKQDMTMESFLVFRESRKVL